MAITITYKSSVYSTTNTAASFTAAPTWTPTANSLLVACVCTTYSASPSDPTSVTGHGVTYDKLTLGTSTLSTTHKLSIWVAKAGGSPTSTACVANTTTTNGTGALIIEFEVTGADVTGTALQAIVASTATNTGTGTAETVTLAAASNSSNRPLIFGVQLSNTLQTAAGSWTLTAGAAGSFNTPATGGAALFNNSTFDTAGAATGANVAWRMVGIEIKAGLELLTASPGSHTVTGAAATTNVSMVASPGSYAVTGVAATPLYEPIYTTIATVDGAVGTYSDTTTAAGTTYQYRVVAANFGKETPSNPDQVSTPAGGDTQTLSPSSYALTGVAASLALSLTCAAGSYAVTGAPQNGTLAEVVSPASYAVTGAAATVSSGFTASPGSYTLTGTAATLTSARVTTASPGSYTITGVAANLITPSRLVVNLYEGSTLRATRTITPSSTTQTFAFDLTSGEAASITNWANLKLAVVGTASSEHIDVTWSALWTPPASLDLEAEPGNYAVTGASQSYLYNPAVVASPGAYPITGVPATALGETSITADPGGYAVTGANASAIGTTSLLASPGSYAVTGKLTTEAIASLPQVSYVGSVTATTNAGTSLAITFTSPAVAGDLAIVTVSHRAGTGGTITGPAGWTALGTQQNSGTTLATRLFSKTLVSGDLNTPLTFNFGTGSAVKGVVLGLIARGSSVQVVLSAHQTNSSQASIPVPALTMASQGVLLFAIGSKAIDTAHTQITGWTLDPAATVATSGGSATTRNRASGQYQFYQSNNPPAVTIPSTTAAVSTGHQVAIGATAALAASPGAYAINGEVDTNVQANFSLTAVPGSYAVTGAPATANLAESAVPGSYATTGASVGLGGSSTMVASPGSYVLTGVATTATIGEPVTPGSYVVTGVAENSTVTDTASPGSYAVTGTSASLLGTLNLSAATGSYAVTGAVENGTVGDVCSPGSYAVTGVLTQFALAATESPGSYAVTGASASLVAGNVLSTAPSAYAVTGVAAKFAFSENLPVGGYVVTGIMAVPNPTLVANPSSYAVNGALAIFAVGYQFTATPGSYMVTGSPTTLAAGTLFSASPGAYAVTGTAVSATFSLSASPGSYAVTGVATAFSLAENAVPGNYAVTLVDATYIVPAGSFFTDPGNYEINGVSATLGAPDRLTVDPGTYAVTGLPMNPGLSLVAGPGSYALTGNSANVLASYQPLSAVPGTYAVAGASTTLTSANILTATSGSYGVTGLTISVTFTAALPAGAYNTTGVAATLVAPVGAFTGDPGSYAVTGKPASVTANYSLTASPGAYAVSGVNTASQLQVAVGPSSYVITGTSATATNAVNLSCEPGSYALIGLGSTLDNGQLLIAEPGSYLVQGFDFQSESELSLQLEPGAYEITGKPTTLQVTSNASIKQVTLNFAVTTEVELNLNVSVEVILDFYVVTDYEYND